MGDLKDKNVGDTVYLDGYTSMAQQNAGERKITSVDHRYDSISGERFKIIQISNGEWFDTRDGGCYSNKNSMYYLE